MAEEFVSNGCDLRAGIANTVFAFRGYNVTNLGRTAELLAHPRYGPIVKQYLQEASGICAEISGRKVDLVSRVRHGREPSLRQYYEALALIVAAEMAQMTILEQLFDVPTRKARLVFGYSLGEITAVAFGGMFELSEALKVPLSMAKDSADLAKDVTLGVLFSRGPAFDVNDVKRLCLRVNVEGHGVIGMSAILSPNTVLLLGQQQTMQRFSDIMHQLLHRKVHLRINSKHWPPLHTPIIWQRNIPNRAAVMMQTIPDHLTSPQPPIFSLVTGQANYTDITIRDILQQWVDHPQRLWDALYETLATGANTVIHVGPEPNLIPATFKRLSDNVREQVSGKSLGSLGLRAISGMARRPWLASLLPSRTALLRAPNLKHINLEDWLLDQPLN